MFENKLYLNDFEMQAYEKAITCEYNCTIGHDMPFLHWHPHYEFNLVVGGKYTICNNTEVIRNDRPAIFIHSPYSLHSVNADHSQVYTRKIIYLLKELVQEFYPTSIAFPELTGANLMYAYLDESELAEFEMLYEYVYKRQDDVTSSALITALIIRRTTQIIKDGRGAVVSCHYSYIQDALQYISNNLSAPVTIAELAEKYSVGRSKFQADFKSATGYPYQKYLTLLRLTKAKNMLASGAGIINASLECGYSSEAHFVKAFRGYWGMTPGEYLRSVRCQSDRDMS